MRFLYLILFGCILVIPIYAHPAYGIVVDKYRNIYFADIHHNGRGSLWKLPNGGSPELLLGDFHAHNVALDEEGNIYSAHGEDTHTMIRISNNGIDTLFSTSDITKFFGGNATYSQGRIIFSLNHYLWKIEKDVTTKLSDHYFEWNQSIYADEDGVIYASDKAYNGGSIVKIKKDECSEVIASKLISILSRPVDKHNDVILGITKGCDDNIYVAESAGKRIIQVNKDGSTKTYYSPTDNWTPVGIDFFSGDAYVLEYQIEKNLGPRITLIKEDFTKEILYQY